MTRNHFNKEMERDKRRLEKLPPLSVPALLDEIKWYTNASKLFKRGKKWVDKYIQ